MENISKSELVSVQKTETSVFLLFNVENKEKTFFIPLEFECLLEIIFGQNICGQTFLIEHNLKISILSIAKDGKKIKSNVDSEGYHIEICKKQ